MEWTNVKDGLPKKEEVGDKVMIHRKMNKAQSLNAYSVHDTTMVKYCDEDTYWMPLPPPPKRNNQS